LITLTRRYLFSAAHVLAREDWDDERNVSVYGKCANPSGHGHNYELFVTVSGQPEAGTGMILPAGALDRVVHDRVLSRLDGRLLNRDVPEFEKEVPTAENIARFAWRALEGRLGPSRLSRVRLVETSNNSVEYGGEDE
jgi:6-pyruvoyltetrahydropterin/6-carboxytetrahydropterin synthase